MAFCSDARTAPLANTIVNAIAQCVSLVMSSISESEKSYARRSGRMLPKKLYY
ncbi:hypothetical protein BN137_3436 [Cronobacter condimenti 1330]|uniref:Uncharacterized protein n=1 Tax=Cronobacter condimenti 1330 TaxID=1073999 RepID=K8A2N3_9ENTR|nr:hypothetical protein BN137_3436 [Cronobacter condimenti 1330]